MSRSVVLYHDDMDGFAAACVVAAYLASSKTAYSLDDAEFYSVQYDNPIPVEVAEGHGLALFIVDFSFPLEQMKDLIGRSEAFYWYDHHKSSLPVYEALRRDETSPGWFHIAHAIGTAGAVLTWKELFDIEVPQLLKYVQDRDLWTWELKDSREISAALDLIWRPRWNDPGKWGVEFFTKHISHLIPIGKSLLARIETRVKGARANYEVVEIGGHRAAAVNATIDISEIGHGLIQEEGIDVGVMFFRTPDGWVHSLRSEGDVDVSVIAKSFGGGGHKHAAGFRAEKPIVEWGAQIPVFLRVEQVGPDLKLIEVERKDGSSVRVGTETETVEEGDEYRIGPLYLDKEGPQQKGQ